MSKAILSEDQVSLVRQGRIAYVVSYQYNIAVLATIHNVQIDQKGRFVAPTLPKAWMDQQKYV